MFTHIRRWKPTVVCTFFMDGGVWRKGKNWGTLSLLPDPSPQRLSHNRAWTLVSESLAPLSSYILETPLNSRLTVHSNSDCYRIKKCPTAPKPFVPRVAQNFDSLELFGYSHPTNTYHIVLVHLNLLLGLYLLEIKPIHTEIEVWYSFLVSLELFRCQCKTEICYLSEAQLLCLPPLLWLASVGEHL